MDDLKKEIPQLGQDQLDDEYYPVWGQSIVELLQFLEETDIEDRRSNLIECGSISDSCSLFNW